MIGVTSREMCEALQQIAEALEMDMGIVAEKCNETMQALSESIIPVAEIAEKFEYKLVELEDLPRTPTEIKKDIKHNKRNPMRLKQLNKELNDSYKWYKRNRKRG